MNVKFAGFWIRSIAYILDTILLSLVGWVLEAVLFGPQNATLFGGMIGVDVFPEGWMSWDPLYLQIFVLSIHVTVSCVYYTVGHRRFATTLGKWCLGIYVLDAKTRGFMSVSQALIRTFASILSIIPVGAGYLMVIFQPEKRALHDLLAGTVSVRGPFFGKAPVPDRCPES